jgi:hypothetical protein
MIVFTEFAYLKIVQIHLTLTLSVKVKWVLTGFVILLVAYVFNLHAICLMTLTLSVENPTDQHINV